MTPQEMRILQEFRRIKTDTMSAAAIKALKHPVGGGEEPALSLVAKGYLTADDARQNFTLTEKSRAFLAIDAVPEFEQSGGSAEEPAE
jgi:hypothetical protein